MKRIWTPLELAGIQLYYAEDRHWYMKRRGKPIKRLFNKSR
ncbi:hypothetical protein [Paenibacillus sp. J31TS4]|nr:hypothetical protein [Paenibacillus sp. J31TS4]